jgi:hypothetical protein
MYRGKGKEKDKLEKGRREEFLPEELVHPVGSPYGFPDIDWRSIFLKREDKGKLFVVFGLQYKSQFYNSDLLIRNIYEYFQKTVKMYNEKHPESDIVLEFEKLTAGYGEHLFNTIVRDIISSDIAIFEISDQNPNVMIELGVALTWGVCMLPLKEKNSPEPPSDISGQTWIEYKRSGEKILDKEFHKKLMKMIERIIAKKGFVNMRTKYVP